MHIPGLAWLARLPAAKLDPKSYGAALCRMFTFYIQQPQHQAGRLPWVTVLGEGATGRKPTRVAPRERCGA